MDCDREFQNIEMLKGIRNILAKLHSNKSTITLVNPQLPS